MWIARDIDGSICIYREKPKKISKIFIGGNCIGRLKTSDFPNVNFENSPVEVELKIKK